jgi:hypothetical protein
MNAGRDETNERAARYLEAIARTIFPGGDASEFDRIGIAALAVGCCGDLQSADRARYIATFRSIDPRERSAVLAGLNRLRNAIQIFEQECAS